MQVRALLQAMLEAAKAGGLEEDEEPAGFCPLADPVREDDGPAAAARAAIGTPRGPTPTAGAGGYLMPDE